MAIETINTKYKDILKKDSGTRQF